MNDNPEHSFWLPVEILLLIFDICPEMDLLPCVTVDKCWSRYSQKSLHQKITADGDHPWSEKLAEKISRQTEDQEFCIRVFYNAVFIEIGELARMEKKAADTVAYQLELDNEVDDIELIAFDD